MAAHLFVQEKLSHVPPWHLDPAGQLASVVQTHLPFLQFAELGQSAFTTHCGAPGVQQSGSVAQIMATHGSQAESRLEPT
jgi:hypothetical protein